MIRAVNTRSLVILTALAAFTLGGSAEAAEGGGSHYLPGTAGDIAIALVPEPGLQVSNSVFVQSGDAILHVFKADVGIHICSRSR